MSRDDTAAFEALYNRYRQETYRYMLTVVKVPELAEDLVQDVFIKVWDVRARLDIRVDFRSYLFRICHNSAIDLNKRIAADRRLLDNVLKHWQLMAEAEPFTQEELLQYDNLVEEALGSLSPQRRRIYELCKKENKSYEEVARELNISANTVKTHIKQTLALLRTYIRKNADVRILIILLGTFL
jgi:RNA polymerase sigma-70 factor (ECF subfamily)